MAAFDNDTFEMVEGFLVEAGDDAEYALIEFYTAIWVMARALGIPWTRVVQLGQGFADKKIAEALEDPASCIRE